jgi:hypothetical protein
MANPLPNPDRTLFLLAGGTDGASRRGKATSHRIPRPCSVLVTLLACLLGCACCLHSICPNLCFVGVWTIVKPSVFSQGLVRTRGSSLSFPCCCPRSSSGPSLWLLVVRDRCSRYQVLDRRRQSPGVFPWPSVVCQKGKGYRGVGVLASHVRAGRLVNSCAFA